MNRVIVLLLGISLFSCADRPSENVKDQQGFFSVVPVNYPLYYFADRIGGDLIDLAYPIPAGIDPAYWTPDEKALELYQSADLILKNGAGYARWTNNVSLPSSRVLNTTAALDEKLIRMEETTTHSHGPEGEHEHEKVAFTTWLDFEIAIQQASSIKKGLEKGIPEKSQELTSNFQSLKKDLEAIHNELLMLAPEFSDQILLGSHPVYQYLAKAYDLNIVSVHFEPDKMPSVEEWSEFDRLIGMVEGKIMLWEGVPNKAIQTELVNRGLEIVVFEPCGNKPSEGDFLSVMKNNLKNLKEMSRK